MKNLRTLIAAVLCVLFASSPAFAFNDAERMAQRQFIEYLRTLNYKSNIDNNDNSVNFLKNNVLYWVTFEGNGTTMLFTLHRKPIRMDSDKDDADKNSRRIEIAYRATNYLNANNTYKSYVRGNRVEFEFPVYSASVADYNKVFRKIMSAFDDVDASYRKCHERAKVVTDSIHKFWMENDTAYKVMKQKRVTAREKLPENVSIDKVYFRNVTSNGTEISGYDEIIRHNDIRYIQPRVSAMANKAGVYKIGVRIVTPRGKILVPDNLAKMTMVSTADLKKKYTDVEFDIFGSDDNNDWEPGEYKVYFYEDGREITHSTFNVL